MKMCGIVGYVGERAALPILLGSLQRIEYRGYDSCGILVQDNASGEVHLYKGLEPIASLIQNLDVSQFPGTIGIGHTRWATHGIPSKRNAHPHMDCKGEIAVVHNGIIENFQSLKDRFLSSCQFRSETDTEVIPHLIEKLLMKAMKAHTHHKDFSPLSYSYSHSHSQSLTADEWLLKEAIRESLSYLAGSYAIIVAVKGFDGLIAARKESPLIIGLGDRENFIASDVPAVLEQTNRVIYLEEGDLAVVKKDRIYIENGAVEVTGRRGASMIPWTIEDAEKGGYEHFMLKEIHEEPKAIIDTLRGYLTEDGINLGIEIRSNIKILMVACGTSYYAALCGKYIIEHLAGIPVRVELASEFNYSDFVLGDDVTVIAITQSGETADTLAALKKAKRFGCRTVAITNVLGSSATRIADDTIYIRAGPEIGVAATKSFIAQLIILYLLGFYLAMKPEHEFEEWIEELKRMPQLAQMVLDDADAEIRQYARYLAGFEDVFFVGRGVNLPVAFEGALKLKEISYIHAEGYAAGELKHGPFALLTQDTPVVAILSGGSGGNSSIYEKTLGNIKEIKARGAPVIVITVKSDDEVEKYVDAVIHVPDTRDIFLPIPTTVALHLLAYWTARTRGCEIDKPRNLAKSVTVE